MTILRKKKVVKSEKKEEYLVVDFPQEDEIVTSPNYTIRIGAGAGNTVGVFLDAGDWKTCRLAEGYWWYDWADYPPGFHRIKARIRDEKGKIVKTSFSRNCQYQPEKLQNHYN